MRLRPPTWKLPWKVPNLRGLPWQQLPLTLMLASALAALGSVQMTFLIGNSLYRHYAWQAETRTVQREVAQLRQDLRVLQDTRAHGSDPDYLSAMARCLGFVGTGETVVVAQGATDGPGGNCDPVRLP
ncbi:septum formation initiator family protein [Deinococcus sonorensis]|uniref:Septum formation initiator family protein n=2 Tax=Deinococcus sonorensis TaxID=309891 RepID=A0AAU7UE46_9DEIO